MNRHDTFQLAAASSMVSDRLLDRGYLSQSVLLLLERRLFTPETFHLLQHSKERDVRLDWHLVHTNKDKSGTFAISEG